METVTELFKALADPTRQKLYRILLQEELCVCELTGIFDVSQSAISQHLRRLKSAGLVNDRRQGQWVFYEADPHALEKAITIMAEFQTLPLDSQADLSDEYHRLLDVKNQDLCGMRSQNGN